MLHSPDPCIFCGTSIGPCDPFKHYLWNTLLYGNVTAKYVIMTLIKKTKQTMPVIYFLKSIVILF
jgi:hypothetical protein